MDKFNIFPVDFWLYVLGHWYAIMETSFVLLHLWNDWLFIRLHLRFNWLYACWTHAWRLRIYRWHAWQSIKEYSGIGSTRWNALLLDGSSLRCLPLCLTVYHATILDCLSWTQNG